MERESLVGWHYAIKESTFTKIYYESAEEASNASESESESYTLDLEDLGRVAKKITDANLTRKTEQDNFNTSDHAKIS